MNAPWVGITAVPVVVSRPCVRDVPIVPHGPAPNGRSVRRLLVAVAIAAALGGCGTGHHSAASASTTTAPDATTSTLPVNQAVALAAWRHYWDIYIAVGEQMQLPDARLAQVATGDELRTLGGAFLADKSEGHVLKGSIELDPKVVSIDGSAATLRDCYLSHILVYNQATNQPTGSGSTNRTLVTVTLMLDNGTWKVSAIRHEGDGCSGP